MTIAACDNCGKVRPGAGGFAHGIEGWFCHICRGDVLDPYGELECMHCGEGLEFNSKISKWVTYRDHWKCNPTCEFPVRAHCPKEQVCTF